MTGKDSPLTVGNLVERFAGYLGETGRSEATRRFYLTDVRGLLAAANVGYDSVLAGDQYHGLADSLRDHIASQEFARDRSSASVNRTRSSTRAFMEFLVQNGYIPSIPILGQRKKDYGDLRLITEWEFKRLMDRIPPNESYLDARNRAVLALMMGAGLTTEEAAGLDTDDIFLTGTKRIRIRVENPERELQIDEPTDAELDNYETAYRRDTGNKFWDKEPYFRNRWKERITRRSIVRNFHIGLKKARLPRMRAYALRLAYAKRQLEKGVDEAELARLMGISVFTSTILKSRLEKLSRQ